MTKTINAAIVVYAVLCIGLGVEAYIAKQSLPSLMGGGGIGVLELVSLFVWTKNPRAGRIMSLLVALGGMGRFIKPFFSEGKIYPAGVMVIASLVLVGLLLAGHMQAMQAKRDNPSA